MDAPRVRAASREAEAGVLAVVVPAFAADPFARWATPDPGRYLAEAWEVIRAFGGRGFDHGTVDALDGGPGAAMWLPPGVEPDGERMAELMFADASEAVAADLEEILAAMDAAHPRVPHWYLPLIGTDPRAQGEGHGARLMRHGLARSDADGLPAYLESSGARNVPSYGRLGFRRLTSIRVGAAPELVPMLRPVGG